MANFRPLLAVQSHKGTQIQTGQQWKSRPEQSTPSSRTPARMLQNWERIQGRLDTGTRGHSVCLLSLSQLSMIECSVQKFLRQERFVFSYATSKIQSYCTGQDFKINPGQNAAQKHMASLRNYQGPIQSLHVQYCLLESLLWWTEKASMLQVPLET